MKQSEKMVHPYIPNSAQQVKARMLEEIGIRDIDELYTEYVFDPFTFTERVPSRLKRRLYELVAVQMFNQMVDRATASNDPFNCEKVLNQLYEVQGSMYVLKDRNTKKLEGRLKRHDDLDERLNILSEELE